MRVNKLQPRTSLSRVERFYRAPSVYRDSRRVCTYVRAREDSISYDNFGFERELERADVRGNKKRSRRSSRVSFPIFPMIFIQIHVFVRVIKDFIRLFNILNTLS